MQDHRFTNEQLGTIKLRHAARKSNQSWGKEDIQSATEDIDNLLAELDRKIGMVEHTQDECRKRADQITALSASSSKLK
jgi:hypothetical protein